VGLASRSLVTTLPFKRQAEALTIAQPIDGDALASA
jgi:hypothetical protein